MLPSTRPTVWVRNWVPAARRSCSSHGIGTMRHPSASKNESSAATRFWRAADAPTRTLSYTNARPAQEPAPESGPNMGWVHRMSKSRGSAAKSARFGNSLTDRTSTKRVDLDRGRKWTCVGAKGGENGARRAAPHPSPLSHRFSRCSGSECSTSFVDRMEVARMTTSGWACEEGGGREEGV